VSLVRIILIYSDSYQDDYPEKFNAGFYTTPDYPSHEKRGGRAEILYRDGE